MNPTEQFKVLMVSENHNSFGLRQCVMIAKDGTAFKACANDLNIPKKGDTLEVPVTVGKFKTNYNFSALSFEIPERMEDAPKGVIKEVWQ